MQKMRPRMRIAFLYGGLSHYFLSCLRALKQEYDVELLLVHWPTSAMAPYEHNDLSWIDQIYERNTLTDAQLREILLQFDPQVIYLTGWMDRTYLKTARQFKSKALIVAGTDTQWKGTRRQYLGKGISRWFLQTVIDVMWVAGERQRQAAKHFGFTASSCWSGVYACDWSAFALHGKRTLKERKKSFLFVGRLAPEKGIDILATAYAAYRSATNHPWELICAGTGSFVPPLWDQKGIEHLGFVQPHALPKLMSDCAAFVLPSIEEPWGVVIQEAAVSGLPLICTDSCGATVHLLYDNYNGFLVDTGSAEQLAHAMLRMSSLSEEDWEQMSQRSFELSGVYTPSLWASTLMTNSCDHPKLRGEHHPSMFSQIPSETLPSKL